MDIFLYRKMAFCRIWHKQSHLWNKQLKKMIKCENLFLPKACGEGQRCPASVDVAVGSLDVIDGERELLPAIVVYQGGGTFDDVQSRASARRAAANVEAPPVVCHGDGGVGICHDGIDGECLVVVYSPQTMFDGVLRQYLHEGGGNQSGVLAFIGGAVDGVGEVFPHGGCHHLKVSFHEVQLLAQGDEHLLGNLELCAHQFGDVADGFVVFLVASIRGIVKDVEDEMRVDAVTGVGNLELDDFHPLVGVSLS